MKKSDLKTGMVVETRSGQRALVFRNTCISTFGGHDAVVFASDNWTSLDGFDEDLNWISNDTLETRIDFCKTVDIVAVYVPELPSDFFKFHLLRATFGVMKCIWKRKEEEVIITEEHSDRIVITIFKK